MKYRAIRRRSSTLLVAVFVIATCASTIADDIPQPEILPRETWDAGPVDDESGVLKPIGEVHHVSVHHTAVGWLRAYPEGERYSLGEGLQRVEKLVSSGR